MIDRLVVWKFKCGGGIRGGVEVADIDNDKVNEVIVGSLDGFLYVLNHMGKLLWKYNAKAKIESTPLALVKMGQIIFGDDSGNINSINLDGKLNWQYKTDSLIVGSVCLESQGKKHIVVGTQEGKLKLLSHEKE